MVFTNTRVRRRSWFPDRAVPPERVVRPERAVPSAHRRGRRHGRGVGRDRIGPVPRAVRPRRAPRLPPPPDQAEVDRILDKISARGIQSLTRAERQTLHRASRTF